MNKGKIKEKASELLMILLIPIVYILVKLHLIDTND